jgi:hypothetical protein
VNKYVDILGVSLNIKIFLFSFSIILSISLLLTIVKFLEEFTKFLWTEILSLNVDLKNGSSKHGITSLNPKGELFNVITNDLN